MFYTSQYGMLSSKDKTKEKCFWLYFIFLNLLFWVNTLYNLCNVYLSLNLKILTYKAFLAKSGLAHAPVTKAVVTGGRELETNTLSVLTMQILRYQGFCSRIRCSYLERGRPSEVIIWFNQKYYYPGWYALPNQVWHFRRKKYRVEFSGVTGSFQQLLKQ